MAKCPCYSQAVKRNRAESRGFTLIELLVVIAVIAILGAVLLPVLGQAKQRAGQSDCVNNLMQWGRAMMMYADDNNQFYPASRDLNYVATPDNNPIWTEMYTDASKSPPIGMSDWFNALPPYVSQLPLWEYGANGASNNVFFSTHSIFICPTARAIPRNPATDPDPAVGPTFNYGMNQRINYPGEPEVPFRITQARNPAAFVVFSEQRVHASETPYYGNNPTDLSSTYNCYNRFSGRHNQGGNIVFGDGHAAWFKYSYVCEASGGTIVDPGDFDINWTYTGVPVPH